MNAANVIKRVFIARLEKFLDYSKRRTVVDRTCPIYVILRVCQKSALLKIENKIAIGTLPTMTEGAWKNLIWERICIEYRGLPLDINDSSLQMK